MLYETSALTLTNNGGLQMLLSTNNLLVSFCEYWFGFLHFDWCDTYHGCVHILSCCVIFIGHEVWLLIFHWLDSVALRLLNDLWILKDWVWTNSIESWLLMGILFYRWLFVVDWVHLTFATKIGLCWLISLFATQHHSLSWTDYPFVHILIHLSLSIDAHGIERVNLALWN